jgi:hypothetical protein
MAELKTRESDADVAAFLETIEDPERKADCEAVAALMARLTGAPARMWGPSIVGFDRYHYVYESGREGDWMLTGFSPRKQNLTLYIMSGFSEAGALMAALGRHKTGKSCLYLRRLSDVDLGVLESLIARSIEALRARYGPAGSDPGAAPASSPAKASRTTKTSKTSKTSKTPRAAKRGG